MGPGHFIYGTQHSLFHQNSFLWRWFWEDEVHRVSDISWQFVPPHMTYLPPSCTVEKIDQRYYADQIFILFNRVSMSNAILAVARRSHQGHERVRDIFRGRPCTLTSYLCAQSCPLLHCRPNCNRRRLDVIESQSILDIIRYRDVFPDFSGKSSSLDSSLAHWDHITKSIPGWGPKFLQTKALRNRTGKYFKESVEAQTILNELLLRWQKLIYPLWWSPLRHKLM